MNILAIDVGNITGYAFMNDEGVIQMTGNVHADDLHASVLAVWSMIEDLDVCIEYPQFSVASSTAILRHAIYTIGLWYPNAYLVRPGVWKQSAAALQPLPKEMMYEKLTQHEKDAINIARWYKHRLTDLGKYVSRG